MAFQSAVGTRVIVNGCIGEVLRHDPDDACLSYKVIFADGSSDWFKEGDVSMDTLTSSTSHDRMLSCRETLEVSTQRSWLSTAQRRQEESKQAATNAKLSFAFSFCLSCWGCWGLLFSSRNEEAVGGEPPVTLLSSRQRKLATTQSCTKDDVSGGCVKNVDDAPKGERCMCGQSVICVCRDQSNINDIEDLM